MLSIAPAVNLSPARGVSNKLLPGVFAFCIASTLGGETAVGFYVRGLQIPLCGPISRQLLGQATPEVIDIVLRSQPIKRRERITHPFRSGIAFLSGDSTLFCCSGGNPHETKDHQNENGDECQWNLRIEDMQMRVYQGRFKVCEQLYRESYTEGQQLDVNTVLAQ
ncbi:uncharacterized protein FOMMEDRAFT_25401 [Fomitiporia mediterranea MF3/22]|uniref:uncharacterized protein n=1 Tax=Fomitiporia mediterranea (strain MF3/22) TaxID=694068 RepID=UPI0004409778|nr:uncharacterized protein FOMMEDRAFT_25401 [Fomitiporia mediterranea MF3/22]EJD08267.1 hypothetical protein FOMMEDRAFT_25401 [Fomitiporia mediterranea MF3/22]